MYSLALSASSILNIFLSLQKPPDPKHLLRNPSRLEEQPDAAIVEGEQPSVEHDNKPPCMMQHEIATSHSTPALYPPQKPESATELYSPFEHNAYDSADMEAVASPIQHAANQGALPNPRAVAG